MTWIFEAALNLLTLVGGSVALGYQYGWKVGVGVACIAWFVKPTR